MWINMCIWIITILNEHFFYNKIIQCDQLLYFISIFYKIQSDINSLDRLTIRNKINYDANISSFKNPSHIFRFNFKLFIIHVYNFFTKIKYRLNYVLFVNIFYFILFLFYKFLCLLF